MPTVPTFSLYGERGASALGDWLHCESIQTRSRIHHWEIRPHRHPHFFQILYLSAGAGECVLEDRRARLSPATVVTVPPGAVHGFRFSQDVQGWVLTVAADRAAAAAEAEPGDAFVEPRLVWLGEGGSARAVGACLDIVSAEIADRRAGRDALIEAQLRSVFILLGRNLPSAAVSQSPSSALRRRADEFRALLNRHFRAERSLAFYARRLGVSETHLNRICRAAMDRSALGVIHDRVLAEAARDLVFTTMTVAEIAGSLGFDDPAYFSRFFCKHAGEGPRAYRQRLAKAAVRLVAPAGSDA